MFIINGTVINHSASTTCIYPKISLIVSHKILTNRTPNKITIKSTNNVIGKRSGDVKVNIARKLYRITIRCPSSLHGGRRKGSNRCSGNAHSHCEDAG